MYCSSLKFKNETTGMCCTGRKVKLQELDPTPEPNLVSGGTSQSKHFLSNTITCQHSKCKGKFIIVLDQHYHYRKQITNFFKFISWKTLMNKSINVLDSILASNDKLSLHYKLYLINTTNEFKHLQFQVLFTFAMTKFWKSMLLTWLARESENLLFSSCTQ